jgi:hypothetical protein
VLTHIIPAGTHVVAGVTTLANHLFVVRQTAQQQIEVYDTANFTQQTNISVPDLQYAYGMASCSTNNCLYVSNHNDHHVYRIELSGTNTVTNSKWQVGAHPIGLFVNSACNVIVTCYNAHKIQEYGTRGSLIREIDLQQSGITNPWYSIQLTDDQFVVSHYHRVCIVNANGTLVSYYGSTTAGSADGQLHQPVTLRAVSNGCILVADCNNNRINVWNQLTNSMRDLSLPTTDTGLQQPFTFHLDNTTGRLILGEWNGRRVLVFDNVFNFT